MRSFACNRVRLHKVVPEICINLFLPPSKGRRRVVPSLNGNGQPHAKRCAITAFPIDGAGMLAIRATESASACLRG